MGPDGGGTYKQGEDFGFSQMKGTARGGSEPARPQSVSGVHGLPLLLCLGSRL